MNATRLTKPDDDSLPYRNLMCNMIRQAYNFARGKEMTDFLGTSGRFYKKYKEREIQEARRYIDSIGFREDCDLIGIDWRAIRAETPRAIWPPPTEAKKIMNKKYGREHKIIKPEISKRIMNQMYNNIGGKKI